MAREPKSFIYLSLRPSTKQPGQNIVIGISKFISGPFYRFEEADQDPDAHELFARQIKAAKFKYLNNLRCDLVNQDERELYMDENGAFRFKNKLLQRVQPGDEDFTLIGQHKTCRNKRQLISSKQSDAQIAINSRGKQVLKQKCTPANLPFQLTIISKEKKKRTKCTTKTSVLDEQQEFLNLHHSLYPNRKLILEQTRNGLRFAEDKRPSAAKKRAGAAEVNNNQFAEQVPSINQIYELYVKLRSAGITKFDPLRANTVEWMSKFETLVSNCGQESDELLFTLIPYFLEPTLLDYLKFMREQVHSMNWPSFREQFLLTFSSFKSEKIQEAFGYQYKDGDLVDYAKKKFELIDRVFPDLSDFDKIRSVIAGMNRKYLIDHFSLNMAHDKDEFIIKVTELALGIPH